MHGPYPAAGPNPRFPRLFGLAQPLFKCACSICRVASQPSNVSWLRTKCPRVLRHWPGVNGTFCCSASGCQRPTLIIPTSLSRLASDTIHCGGSTAAGRALLATVPAPLQWQVESYKHPCILSDCRHCCLQESAEPGGAASSTLQQQAGEAAGSQVLPAWSPLGQQAPAPLSAGQGAPALPGQGLWEVGTAAAAAGVGCGQGSIPALHGQPAGVLAGTPAAQQAWGQGLIPALHGSGTEATASSSSTAQLAGTGSPPAQGLQVPFKFGAGATDLAAPLRHWNKTGPRLPGKAHGQQQPGAGSQALCAAPEGDGGGAVPAAIGCQLPQAQNESSAADPADLITGIEIKQVCS